MLVKIDGAEDGRCSMEICQAHWWSMSVDQDISGKPETFQLVCKESSFLRVFWVASKSNRIALRGGNCMLPARTSFFQTGIIPHPFHGTFVFFPVLLALKRNQEHPKTCYKKTNQYSIITSGVTPTVHNKNAKLGPGQLWTTLPKS